MGIRAIRPDTLSHTFLDVYQLQINTSALSVPMSCAVHLQRNDYICLANALDRTPMSHKPLGHTNPREN